MNKWDAFKTQFDDSNIHIFVISETWLSDSISSHLFSFSNNFSFLRNDRKWCQPNSIVIKKKRRGSYKSKISMMKCLLIITVALLI